VRLSCQCLGVAPVARRNVFVKWLWSAKPVWIAINAMDSLPSNRSSCAKYAFLNRLLAVGIGEIRQDGPIHRIEEFSNNHRNEMAPAKADVSILVDDQCPTLLGDNFPQRELGLWKRPEYRSTYQRKEIER
jgi:hypothetical protein